MAKVLVGNYWIELIYLDSTNMEDCLGKFSARDRKIMLLNDLHGLSLLETIMHEVSHAIYWAYGIDDEDKEERVVSLMSTGWTQVIRDNPYLLSMINELGNNWRE